MAERRSRRLSKSKPTVKVRQNRSISASEKVDLPFSSSNIPSRGRRDIIFTHYSRMPGDDELMARASSCEASYRSLYDKMKSWAVHITTTNGPSEDSDGIHKMAVSSFSIMSNSESLRAQAMRPRSRISRVSVAIVDGDQHESKS